MGDTECGEEMTGEWIKADKNHLPKDKEHIIFYADWWSDWSQGIYWAYDRIVQTRVLSSVYHTVMLEDGMYWMRVPELPKKKKRR